MRIEGYTSKSKDDTLVFDNQVSDGFFKTLGTDLLEGRDFNSHDTPVSTKVAIVNQRMAKKFFTGQSPIGRRYRSQEGNSLSDPVEIIGVVKDSKYVELREDIVPPSTVAASQDTNAGQSATFELRVDAGTPMTVISPVKSSIAQVNRYVSLEFKTLALQVDESLARERLLATLSGFFGGLALLLAMIGLYGVVSYSVARRRHEIGIRMALGAQKSWVLRAVLGEVASLIGIGLAIGLGIAMGTTRFVASFLYGTKPNDPWTFSLAAAVIAMVAGLAAFLPARRASQLDPMNALREE